MGGVICEKMFTFAVFLPLPRLKPIKKAQLPYFQFTPTTIKPNKPIKKTLMKKLLLLMALMLSFGLASFAESYTFSTDGLSDRSSVSELKSADGNITVTFEKNTGSNAPTYYTSGDCIRMYANNSFTITASEDVTINSVSYVWVEKGSKWTNPTVSTKSLTVENNQAKFVASAKDNGPRSITVEYTVSSTAKDPAGLAFTEEAYTANLGEDFTAPELTNPNGLEVTYKSSNEAVATVATDGNITILAAGTTTITATSAETEEFKAGEASYTLSVIDPNAKEATFNFSEMGYSNTDVVSKCQSGIVTLDLAAGSNSNPPKYYNTGTGVRLYGGNTLTVSVPNGYYLTEISFTTDSSSNSSFNDGTTATAGTFSGLSWTANGQNNTVTITNGGSKGHVRIQTITVKYAEIPSGIADIEAEENGVVEYFNLQGVRVDEPANGLYIRRAGNKVEKVIVR